MKLPEGLPERTVGWDVLEWGSVMLAQPDGPRRGEQMILYDEQARFVLWFYAVDENGRFVYRYAMLERPKGWGKSPLLAFICCAEFMGPTDFGGFDPDTGQAVGQMAPSPRIQIAAISESQANNTYELCMQMLLLGAVTDYYPDLEVMLSKSVYPGEGRILEKVTASPQGREGNRPTFVVMDETHWWTPAQHGPQLYGVLKRNLAKLNRRYIMTTNAPVPGENSVAEAVYDGYMQSIARGETPGLLMDSKEVYVKDIYDKKVALPALMECYGDSLEEKGGHVNIERIWEELNDPTVSEPDARRFYFNQRVRSESSWLNYDKWMACKDDEIKLKNWDQIALGFKSANEREAAVLIGCRLSDFALFELGWWEPDIEEVFEYELADDGSRKRVVAYQVPWNEVDARVQNVFNHHDVMNCVADPVGNREAVAGWHATYPGRVEEFWFSNRGKFVKLVNQFEQAVNTGRLKWKSTNLSRHVLNSYQEEVLDGYIIRKDKPASTRYIGGAKAALLAIEAATLAIHDGALQGSGQIFSFSPGR